MKQKIMKFDDGRLDLEIIEALWSLNKKQLTDEQRMYTKLMLKGFVAGLNLIKEDK